MGDKQVASNSLNKLVKTSVMALATTALLGGAVSTLSTTSDAATGILFEYTGTYTEWVAPANGDYLIECWGAQGGQSTSGVNGKDKRYNTGKGGYSRGTITLQKDDKLYICVGQRGIDGLANTTDAYFEAWNGGGRVYYDTPRGSGGGATHVATKLRGDGQLVNYEYYKSDVVLVAGGAGGGSRDTAGVTAALVTVPCTWGGGVSGYVEGYEEGTGGAGTQTAGGVAGHFDHHDDDGGGGYDVNEGNPGSFGKGGYSMGSDEGPSGGGGWYGGGSAAAGEDDGFAGYRTAAGGAGSGYVNTSLLKDSLNITQCSASYAALGYGIYGGDGRVVITPLHTHNYTWVTTTAATCTTAGSKVYKCTGTATDAGCDHIDKTEAIPALGHAWPTDYSYADNNGITNGLAYKNCTRTGCGVRLDTKWLNRIRVRYQNADGTYGSYTNAENGYYYSGQTISWSRAADGAYQYAGTSWTSTEQAKSVDLTVYRNSYTLTLNKGIGISAVSGAGAKLYGASATIDATVKPGYTWKDWTGTTTYTAKNQSFNMPAYNVTLTANATPNPDTPYIVNHWVQKVDAVSTEENEINYELVLTEPKEGITDTLVTPPVYSYEGCISPAPQTVNINGDESTVVNYYYTRVKVTLDVDGEYLAEHFGTTEGLCTFDVYINDILVADDETDYFNDQILYGSTWRIYDINPVGGKHYTGTDIQTTEIE